MQRVYVSHKEWRRRNLFDNGNTHNVIKKGDKLVDRNNQKQEIKMIDGKPYKIK